MKKYSKVLIIVIGLALMGATLSACGNSNIEANKAEEKNENQININKDLMDRYINDAYKRGVFNGTVLLAKGDQIIYENAAGFANQKNKKNLNIDTVFELASVSKQFTASSIMILRDQGRLSLSDKLEKYFPEIPYKGITVKNLLNHTSGLPDYMDWVEQNGRKNDTIPDNEIMEKFIVESKLPVHFEPNEGWDYSNTGYSLLALIVEKASGLSYEEFLKKEIFEPAGMKDSQVYHRRLNGEKIDNYAYGYVYENGKYILPDDSEGYSEVIPLDGIEGDGTVNSTVHDMLKWSLTLKEGKILSHETQEEMYTPTTYNHGKIEYYGYGWSIRNDEEMGRIVLHSGGWPGYSTEFVRYIDKDLTFILLSNIETPNTCGSETFMYGLNSIIRGEEPSPIRDFKELLDKNPNTSQYPSFCGKYEKSVEVFMKENKLFANLPGLDQAIELLPTMDGYFIMEDGYFITDVGYSFTFENQRIIVDAKSLYSSVLNKEA